MLRILSAIGLIICLISCNTGSAGENIQNPEMKNYFDSTGNIFVKLYKKDFNAQLYWEIWNTNSKEAVLHWGTIGDKGQSEIINEANSKNFMSRINSLIGQKISEGFSEIPIEKHYTVTITFKLKTWGTTEDIDRREFIRNIVTENLGWTGNGRCDDGDIGSGEMTLFADVVDPEIAIQTLSKELNEKNIKDEHYFGIMLGDSVITKDYRKNKK